MKYRSCWLFRQTLHESMRDARFMELVYVQLLSWIKWGWWIPNIHLHASLFQEHKKRKEKALEDMERTWKLPKDRSWKRKEKKSRLPVMSTTVFVHTRPSAERDKNWPEVKAHSLNDDDDHHHLPSLMPLPLHSRTWRTAETTEHRGSLLSNSSLLFFIFHPPIPALQTLQGINGSLSKQLKVAVTRSSPERRLWESGCMTAQFWVFSEPACCGIFGQEQYLLNLI